MQDYERNQSLCQTRMSDLDVRPGPLADIIGRLEEEGAKSL